MVSKQIVSDDTFLDMSLGAQALYYFFLVNADDDGFVGSPKRLRQLCGASQKNFTELVDKKYLITFESGIVVVRHWKNQNTLKSDRYKHTIYQDEFSLLTLDKAGNYVLKSDTKCLQYNSKSGNEMETERNQNGTKTEPQISIDKDSIDKVSIDKISVGYPEASFKTEKGYTETLTDSWTRQPIPIRREGYS